MSASSSSAPPLKYDVFLSFRGEDTRETFISYLYDALCQKEIDTFIDYELERGGEISQSLLNAIEESKISVVVFSKGYASSRWCLEELVKILECKRLYGRVVIPVFYRVDPSVVRNQTGTFGDAFVRHEEQFKERLDRVNRWRTALREAANISGWDSAALRPESAFTKEIVKDILKRLEMSPNDYNGLVGVDSIIKEIGTVLFGPIGVYSIGIWGIGGIGKTTIAKAVFNNIACHFEGSYFIENIREKSEENGGSIRLQEDILSMILEDRNPNIGLTFFAKKRLRHKKVLIVFDDVTDSKQIEFFIGCPKVFGSGSRIIITTRNKQVLRACIVDEIYDVERLHDNDALKLFSRCAFQQKYPPVGYMELSNGVVKYAEGIPSALKVLGSFLRGRNTQEWESALSKLERTLNIDIQKMLKRSYDGLDDEEQNIFLDIACFFRGHDRNLVKNVLDASGFSTEIGISVLIDLSLITLSSNKIEMHDLFQQMGREVVQKKFFEDPGKCNRLWHHEDIYHVLTKNMGIKAIEGISLDVSKTREIYLDPYVFVKMDKLRLLKIFSSCYGENNNKVHICEGLESFGTKLRYLNWYRCPLKSLPSNFPSENLVALDMAYGSFEQLWNGVKHHVNLKHINLSHCKHLTKIPDLSLVPNLETLILEGCTSLLVVPSSIQFLKKLVILNLRHCKSLRSLPNCLHLESLQTLILSGCSNLNRLLEIPCDVKELLLDETAIKELPMSIGCLSRLVKLDLKNCSRLESLPSSIGKLKSLEYLNISGCLKFNRLPDEIGKLKALKEFICEGTAVREVLSSMVHLNNLKMASFNGCKGQECVGLLLPPLRGFPNLTKLYLTDCGIGELPDNLGVLSSLISLRLDRNNIGSIPTSIKNLCQLDCLNIRHCKKLQSLPELPRKLRILRAHGCTSLESLSGSSIVCSTMLLKWCNFDFANCFELDGILLKHIVKDVLLQFLLRAKHCQLLPCYLCFPGSEIPELFNFRNVGSYITLELPPGWFSSNFAGFALCIVVAFRDHRAGGGTLRICCDCILKIKDDFLCFPCYLPVDLVEGDHIDSDHVFIGYDFSLFDGFIENPCKEVSIQFSLWRCYTDNETIECRETVECCNVKQCGVRLLYVQNPEEAMEEPHPKRLKADPSQE